jgi:hypothetical protein
MLCNYLPFPFSHFHFFPCFPFSHFPIFPIFPFFPCFLFLFFFFSGLIDDQACTRVLAPSHVSVGGDRLFLLSAYFIFPCFVAGQAVVPAARATGTRSVAQHLVIVPSRDSFPPYCRTPLSGPSGVWTGSRWTGKSQSSIQQQITLFLMKSSPSIHLRFRLICNSFFPFLSLARAVSKVQHRGHGAREHVPADVGSLEQDGSPHPLQHVRVGPQLPVGCHDV